MRANQRTGRRRNREGGRFIFDRTGAGTMFARARPVCLFAAVAVL